MPPNREPMWYCHECATEMRPLMVPDPHCASCNGTFVEMIESPRDDPRAFHNMRYDDFGGFPDIFPGPRPGGGGGGGGFTLSINRSSSPGGNTRTFVLGRPGQTDIGPDRVMPLAEFLAETAGNGGRGAMRDGLTPGGIPHQHLMINHILGMLAQRYTDQRGPGAFADILGMHQGGPEGGRLGDYALNQQALDQIMTALMENSNAHRPVPASDEVLNRLDHEVLEEGSPLLQKDCAVCKDQFSLQTEDPDEQVVITLPCKHPFHSPCILPWLKQNGTCPSCRYQLVPQPGSAPNPNGNPGPGPGPSTGTYNPSRPTVPTNFSAPSRTETSSRRTTSPRDRDPRESSERGGGGGGFLGMVGDLLHSLAGGHPNSGPAPSSSGPVPSSSGSGPDSLPGSWEPAPSPHPEPRNRSSRAGNQSTNGPYQNSGSMRSQSSPNNWPDPAFTSSYNSNNRDRNGDSTNERAPRIPGRHRRRSYDRERERNRDRPGQRRNTQPWDDPELD